MNIYPLIDGGFSVDNNKVFSDLERSGNAPGLKMAVQPFLIETDEQLVLLDAGLGWLDEGVPRIIRNIKKADFQPENVDKVLLSHLHKDHINGLVSQQDQDWALNFPNAKIYMQKREYDFAVSKAGNHSYDQEVLSFITEHAAMVWMDADSGNITPEISFEVSGGHTPYHQVFLISEAGKTAFYGGDNLPTAGYLKYPIAFKTDFDGKKALQQRINWEEKAKAENWEILLYHDLKQPILRF
ncbi:MBL fold metallo-hydrolase [Dyadobacter sp. CY312]|uniref:MBL fold metallo-hydrolase n=1 Tax=Dyadobacter sp. CY312 TaxID=2907303 RepID=UPI001F2AC607|nr:MBL fold metallo-hydrolase [Dyadobacter sp. CY312]MCE7039089.1 MBL fold metallo-hydrolase [Dyadobacter sp. CY312]